MRYLVLILISTILLNFNVASAQDEITNPYNFNNLQFQIDQKIANPVKQGIDYLTKKLESVSQNFLEKAKIKKEQKQEEIKQEIRQEAEEMVRQRISRFERWILIPLKNKTQQGSELIRQGIDDIKNFLINLF